MNEQPARPRSRGKWSFILVLLGLVVVASVANLLVQYGRGDPLSAYEVALGIIIAVGATAAFATLLAVVAEYKIW